MEALPRSPVGSLLLPPPNDDHAGGIGRCQQALVTVEADVQHWSPVTLQLVYNGLGVPLHVEEVDAGVLAASHCEEGERSGGRGVRLEVKGHRGGDTVTLHCPTVENTASQRRSQPRNQGG